MTHRFPIKEIAQLAGLGPATVDRVLNNRAHVSQQTKNRVKAAIEELAEQEAQLAARGRRLFFDFVVEGADRYILALKVAAEAVLPGIGTAVCQFRFTQHENSEEEEIVGTLKRILQRGSHGVCIKAPDSPSLKEAIDALSASRIPVVTFASDIPGSKRQCYVGLDYEGAGRTAAYLISRTIKNGTGTVLLPSSPDQSLGDKQREAAFLGALTDRSPQMRTAVLKSGANFASNAHQALKDVLSGTSDLRAVYSSCSDNRLVIKVLEKNGLKPDVYVAHDLNRENLDLISDQWLDYVLHHDLQSDMRTVFNAFLAYHRLYAGPKIVAPSAVHIITPENFPVQSPPS